MAQSTNTRPRMNTLRLKLIFLFSVGISPAMAMSIAPIFQAGDNIAAANGATLPTVNCDANSPECCWVTRSWQLMGKNILSDFSKDKACCSSIGDTYRPGLSGVQCDSTGKVIEINWRSIGLKDHIPAALGELKNLVQMYV